jgi:hypothetical protein
MKSTSAVEYRGMLIVSFISPELGLFPIFVTSKVWRCVCTGCWSPLWLSITNR